MKIKNLKLRKTYQKQPEDYEERLSNAGKLMARWLVRLYIEKEDANRPVRKKGLTKCENYAKLYLQEKNTFKTGSHGKKIQGKRSGKNTGRVQKNSFQLGRGRENTKGKARPNEQLQVLHERRH